MLDYSLTRYNEEKRYIILKSFKITVFLSNQNNINRYEQLVERYKYNPKMKALHLCRLLELWSIPYKLSFCYNRNLSLMMNLYKFRNYIILKYRIKHDF